MSSKKGKRGKGVKINDLSDCVALLPGRRECSCEATKHSLVTNCISCGRIVCSQEGIGNCFTCGQLVSIPQQTKLLRDNKNKQNSKESPTPVPKSDVQYTNSGLKDIAASFDTGLEKAIQQKEKLLEFDKNSSVRTKVFDDENDYFSLDSQNWISNESRKSIASKVEKLHENKLKTNKKILIDLNERTASDYNEKVIKDFDQQIQQLYDETRLKSDYQCVDTSQLISEDNCEKLPNLVYMTSKNKTNERSIQDMNITKRLIDSYNKLKIQDKELMQICDEGMCLSVKQPFASLLVSGVKQYEGRNWYSSFRGRLWIHSSSKKPNDELIRKVENLYRFAGFKTLPNSYPLSAVVGCVTITDCLPIEEYRQKFPESEADDNYIFVCEDPKQLSNPLSVDDSGGHRIYKLNEKIHLTATKLINL